MNELVHLSYGSARPADRGLRGLSHYRSLRTSRIPDDERGPVGPAHATDQRAMSMPGSVYEPFLSPADEGVAAATPMLPWRAGPTERGLYSLRRRINDVSLAAAARPVFTVLYGSDRPTAGAEDDLAAAQGLATSRDWQVRDRFTDTDTRTRPAERPGWNRVRTVVRSGHAHGVIAYCQAAISQDADLYRDELRWLEDCQSALWLVQPETTS